MSDVELRENIVIDGVDAATAKLMGMAQAASRVAASLGGTLTTAIGRVSHAFEGMTHIAGSLLGIAGVWKVAETIHETDRLYQSVQRVKDMTGIAASQAHVLFDQFELSGIEMGSAERIMTSMTRKGMQLAAAQSASAMQLHALMTKMGVKNKDGPEERILALSAAAQEGKVRIDQLIQAFGIPRGQAAQMMTMLRQGPERLKAIQQETLSGADLIDEKALHSYRLMIQARRDLNDAWGGVVGVLYKNLLPAVTVVLQEIKKGMDAIMPVATAIGKTLAEHMTLVVALTKSYLAMLIASKAINMFSRPEDAMGVFARGKSLITGGLGLMSRRAASVGAMDYFEAKAMNPGVGMFQMAGGPLMRIISTVAGRFLLVGAIISVLVVAFEMLKNNTLGLRSAFMATFGRIWATLKDSFMKIVGVLTLLWNAIKPIISIVAGALLVSLLMFAYWIEWTVKVLAFVVDMLVGVLNALIWLLNKIPGVHIDYVDAAKKAEESAPNAPEAPNTQTYQDFRGSKFDITNNFPQGIDGGRVAVAFSDELAALGERRLESGVRPLFSYR